MNALQPTGVRGLCKRHPLAQSILLAFGLCTASGLTAVGAYAQAAAQPAETNVPPPAADKAPTAAVPPAAAASDVKLDTVVITARKRDEKLLEVPISVQAYSEKALRAAGTYDLQDLKSTSGFSYNQAAGTLAAGRTAGVLVFRGLQGDTGLPYENSGSLFIDGIYISGGQSSVNTVDVERVEVLKGPQNAFFGRSTFGGAINFITKKPSSTFKGQVNTSATAMGSSDVDATLEGPLMQDMLSGRVTLVSHRKAAQYHATDGGDLGAEKTTSITTTLYATPSDDLWVRLRGHYQQDDDSSAALGYLSAVGNTSCTGVYFPGQDANGVSKPFTPANPYFCGSIPSLSQTGTRVIDANTTFPTSPAVRNAFINNSLGDPFLGSAPSLDHMGLRRDTTRLSLQAGYELPRDAEVVFNGGYNESKSVSAWDLDRTAVQNFYNVQPILTKDLTLDTRITSSQKERLRGLLGASYFKQTYKASQIDYNAAFGATAATINAGNYLNNKAEVPALYGSLDYDVLSNLTVATEARYQEDKTTAYAQFTNQPYSNTTTSWLPRVTLRFKPDDATMTYVSYSEGVQPLTLNSGYINAPSAAAKAYMASIVPGTNEFSPQPKLKSFEIGIKQRLFDNRVNYSASIYDEKWENRLSSAFIFNPAGCTAATQLTPACPLGVNGSGVIFGNQARIRGLELSADAVVTPAWTVGGYLDYKHARWEKYTNSTTAAVTGTTVNFPGNTLAKTPAWTGTLNSTYRAPITNGWVGYARGDVTYTGSAWDTDFNIVKTDPYYRVNARIGADKGKVNMELFVKNLFDDKHWNYAFRSADLSITPLTSFSNQGLLVQAPDRREIGVRFRYEFE